jgi:Domain of unknown function (DUF4328)
MVAYGQPGAAVRASRVRNLSKAIVVLTAIVAVATVSTSVLSASLSSDAQKFLDEVITEDEFRSSLGLLDTASAVAFGVTVAAAVVTMVWMYRMASNLRATGRRTTWHPLFGVFGWFLPPGLFYIIPFLMLRELWKGSDSELRGDDWRSSGENLMLWLWFALYGIVPTVLVVFEAGNLAADGLPGIDLRSRAESLDDFGVAGFVAALVDVVAAIVWIVLVRQLTERHTRLTGEV